MFLIRTKKKTPKIKLISSAVSGDFLFTLGLGTDGKVYSWNSSTAEWMPHVVAPNPPVETPGEQ